jgi:hypothetical protein
LLVTVGSEGCVAEIADLGADGVRRALQVYLELRGHNYLSGEGMYSTALGAVFGSEIPVLAGIAF